MMTTELYEIVRGPMMWATLLVLSGGTVYRIAQFFRSTVSVPRSRPVAAAPEKAAASRRRFRSTLAAWLRGARVHYRNSIFGMTPVTAWITTGYHIAILLAVFFVEGHNVMLDQSWGVRLPALPEKIMDGLCIGVLAVSAYYLIRRFAAARFQFPTIGRDYLAILITAAPFATGFFAYHQWFDGPTALICHMISGQVFFASLPFTKLGHTIFFVFGRLYLHGELELKSNTRTWKPDALIQEIPRRGADGNVDTETIRVLLDQKKTQMKMMLAFCARCSNCARSCFLYENTGDPAYIPSQKVFQSLGRLYRKKGRVTRSDLEAMIDPIWNRCVLCGRCYCPVGLKIPEMIAFARTICRSQGVYKSYDQPFA